MNPRQELERLITAALARAGAPAGAPAVVHLSARPEFGHYQANGVMAAAKILRTNPRELAARVMEHLDLRPMARSVELAGPGFINITLDDAWLSKALQGLVADERLGVPPAASPQTIVVDYSHPNLAKEMHVGHLRSTIIGDSIVRTLEFLGHKVVRHNHVGDWGTQFGMLIAYMDRLSASSETDLAVKLSDLEQFYRDAKALFDRDEAFAASAREYVVRLQGGDAHCREAWRMFIATSLRHCEEIYARLNVTLQPADVRPESSYNDDLSRVVEDLRKQGLVRESEGALCVFLDEFKGKDGNPLPAIIQKSDGGYLYATTDLAAIRYRAGVVRADRILYIVDARQSLHLQQAFAIARAAGFAPASCSLEHHAFGTMMGQDGRPFKTREGGTVKLMELLDEAEKRALKIIEEKSPSLVEQERAERARIIGIGAVKYADLCQNRTSDYLFSWDKMLALDGNTAPYMQYAYARVRSIFRKGGLDESRDAGDVRVGEDAERTLAVKLLQFPDVVESVGRECYPHMLCTYLYELTQTFMVFYESCPVLKADEATRNSRLLLSVLTARTIRLGLSLLGIETVDRM